MTEGVAFLRILLVEDNADDEFLAMVVLKRLGIESVSVARDGCRALEILHGGVGGVAQPDLVLLDLRLPKVDGLKVLQKIREDSRTAHLPVLVLSSSEDPGDKESCRKLGIVGFVAKPLKAPVLAPLLSLLGKG
jgi:CheY-like chemotaxis protein